MNDAGEDIDRFLTAPLAPVQDDGFSERVMAGIVRRPRPWAIASVVAPVALAALLLVAFLPDSLLEWTADVSAYLAQSQAIATAILAIVLSISYLRFAEEQ